MRLKSIIILCCTFLLVSWSANSVSEVKHVDVAFCIDLSASTNGILNDVRNRMWNITNGILNKHERTDLRVAVVGYGRPSFGSSNGFVRVISGLTNDLDPLSYVLFQIKAVIEKGDQFVPNALFETFKDLKWNTSPDAERMVFLFGNGSVYTGSINLMDLCEEYKKDKIQINTVYVSQSHNIMSHMAGYKGISDATGGQFFIMDPLKNKINNPATQVAPAILSLNDSLNNTFMYYTKDAALRKLFLTETDANALKNGGRFFSSRLLYKTSGHFYEANEPYDLTAYVLKYNKMPARMNLDFLNTSEKTTSIVELEKRARQHGVDRTRLNVEIINLFTTAGKDATSEDTLLENFVLGSYK